MPPIRRSEFAGAILAVAVLGAAGVATLSQRTRPVENAETVRLIDQDGTPRSFADWRGRLIVLDFIYTGCGDVCPLKSVQIAQVQAAIPAILRHRVQFISVSIDPEHDDPAALRAYAARAGADLANWSFLTGQLDAIATVASAFDAKAAVDGQAPDHITIVRLLDATARIVHQYVAAPLDEAGLRSDIEALAPMLAAQRE